MRRALRRRPQTRWLDGGASRWFLDSAAVPFTHAGASRCSIAEKPPRGCAPACAGGLRFTGAAPGLSERPDSRQYGRPLTARRRFSRRLRGARWRSSSATSARASRVRRRRSPAAGAPARSCSTSPAARTNRAPAPSAAEDLALAHAAVYIPTAAAAGKPKTGAGGRFSLNLSHATAILACDLFQAVKRPALAAAKAAEGEAGKRHLLDTAARASPWGEQGARSLAAATAGTVVTPDSSDADPRPDAPRTPRDPAGEGPAAPGARGGQSRSHRVPRRRGGRAFSPRLSAHPPAPTITRTPDRPRRRLKKPQRLDDEADTANLGRVLSAGPVLSKDASTLFRLARRVAAVPQLRGAAGASPGGVLDELVVHAARRGLVRRGRSLR